MPKVAEIAIGAAAIGAAFLVPGAGIAIAGLVLTQTAVAGALISVGASMALAGVSSLIAGSPQGGIATNVKNPIGPWSYVYGEQKVGGVTIFEETNSSQGTSNDKQCHRVFALACHPCQAVTELRIDNQTVPMSTGDGNGYVSYSPTQVNANIASIARANGLATVVFTSPIANNNGQSLYIHGVLDNSFNGVQIVSQPNPADNTTFTYPNGGPDTSSSSGQGTTAYPDYKNKIYMEVRLGNHTTTFSGLLASGTSWNANCLCLGRCVVYVRMGYDSAVFPAGMPNVSFIVQGKNDLLDPRTNTRGYSTNAALCVADFLSLPRLAGGFGLAIGTRQPTAQLIAAANICDEPVLTQSGASIARYTCNTFLTLNATRGAILEQMLSSMAGRLSYQGGQYLLFPAAWPGISSSPVNEEDFVGSIKWTPRLSVRDTCNGVKGTYVSPENAWQQADVPPYIQDVHHGYATDPYLLEDKGERIFMDAQFPCTTNAATAQRLAKIGLMRKRYQGRGTFRLNMKHYEKVAMDVMEVNHARWGWSNFPLEILASRLVNEPTQGADGETGQMLCVEFDVAETDASVYDWFVTEELTPQGYKSNSNVGIRLTPMPEHVAGYSGPGQTINGVTFPNTVTRGADGVAHDSLYVRWDTPNDGYVVFGGHIEVRYRAAAAADWISAGKFDPSVSSCYIPNVNDGAAYSVSVRAVNVASVPSPWVQADGIVASATFSSTGLEPLAQTALTGEAFSDGTAAIVVAPFTLYGVSVLPAGAYTVTGLTQTQLWYVYYVDPHFTGGAITPVATQAQADFLNKPGYFLIGSVVTPYAGAGTGPGGGGSPGSGMRYAPGGYADSGSRTTTSPAAAYDGDTTTAAVVSGSYSYRTGTGTQPNPDAQTGGGASPSATIPGGPVTTDGYCSWSGFASHTLAASATLTVQAAYTQNVGMGATIDASWTASGGASGGGNLFTAAGSAANAAYTLSIPTGVDLSSVSVSAAVNGSDGSGSGPGTVISRLPVAEIFIQT